MHRFTLLIFLAILISFDMTRCQTKDYKEKLESLYNHTVPIISTQELASKIDSDSPIVILDIRSQKEFQISHIKNAVMIDYNNFDESIVHNIALDREIIVYCSVGYRSEKIGDELLDMGFTNVKNLYGGIFQWKNDGFDVINEQGMPTDSVHTYNRSWSQWLLKGVRVY